MIPVEGYKHLYRDEKSGAIVNTDSQGYLQYKKLQQQKKYQEIHSPSTATIEGKHYNNLMSKQML